MKKKGKKSNISISRTKLYGQKTKFCMQIFFFKKCLFEHENQYAVEKTQKKIFGGNFKNTFKIFVVAIKKSASHSFSINGNCMISIFFDKKFYFFI